MILGYHIVLGMYGFWLPNDPRGSWSKFVWSDDLRQFGPVTKVTTRQSRAKDAHNDAHRIAAKTALKYPPVKLSAIQAETLAAGIVNGAELLNRPIWACAIMPDHVHLVLCRTDAVVEKSVAEMKRRGSWEMTRTGRHPMFSHRTPNGRLHSPWARGFWKVYLDTPEAIERSIQYVNENPLKDGLPAQNWSFVVKPDLH